MIRNTIIAGCLIAAVTTMVVGGISWLTDITCWTEGNVASNDNEALRLLREFANHPSNRRPALRIWFSDGSVRVVYISAVRSRSSSGVSRTYPRVRALNRIVFRWQVFNADFVARQEGVGGRPQNLLFAYAEKHLTVPLWVPFILFSVCPTMAFVRGPYRRYRRRKKRLCLKCGYDLTGNVSGVCPECGEPRSNRVSEAERRCIDPDHAKSVANNGLNRRGGAGGGG